MPLSHSVHPIGTPFIELQSVDSTNNYALSQIHANQAEPGTCYFSHEQTAGKGQRGKTWTSERNANIILSIIITPSFLQLSQQFQLSACVAVAIHSFFSKYAGESKIKWPNDLYWGDRKVGGMLIESVVRSQESGAGSWDWAVAGIGININQTHFSDLPGAVSLKQITGKNYDPVDLAKELCNTIDHFYEKLKKNGFDPVLETYRQNLYKKGERVKFKKENMVFEAMVKDVSPTGQLIIHHAIEEAIDFGSIEWLL